MRRSRSDEGNKTHFFGEDDELAWLFRNRVNWVDMSDVAYFTRIKYTVLEADRHSEKGRERVFFGVAVSPASFLRIFFPNSVALLCLSDSLFEHFVHDIVISNSNSGGSFNKGQSGFERSDFTLIHEF